MEKGLTVKQLAVLCVEQIKKGNGDKHILLSDDDEGNGYHTLFYAFSDDPEMLQYAIELEHDQHEIDEIIVLG